MATATATATATTTKLLASQSGKLGILLLNNPKAYHALTMDMVLAAQNVLGNWLDNPNISAILWHSDNNNTNVMKRPSFCSGGDVKSIALEHINNNNNNTNSNTGLGQGTPGLLSSDFFRHEYYLNHALAQRRKIQISLWDGLVLGGGVGISIYGKYRVATQHSIWAMPETAIGFFPDVGSLWELKHIFSNNSRSRNNHQDSQPLSFSNGAALLAYLVLTGQRLRAYELLQTGLATHYVPSQDLPRLQQALVEASSTHVPCDNVDPFAHVLESFHQPPPYLPPLSLQTGKKKEEEEEKSSFSSWVEHADVISKIFDYSDNSNNSDRSIANVLQELQVLDSDFARETLHTLQHKMSPTSLIITWELLKRGGQGKKITCLAEHLQLEYRLSQHLMKPNSDFYEGIRATLLNRQRQASSGSGPPPPPPHHPQWRETYNPDEIVHFYLDQPIDHEWNVQDSPLYHHRQ